MLIDSLRENPIHCILALESRVQNAKKIERDVMNAIYDVVKNWHQIPLDRRNEELSGCMLQLSERIAKTFRSEESRLLAEAVERVSKKLHFHIPTYIQELIERYFPGFKENPKKTFDSFYEWQLEEYIASLDFSHIALCDRLAMWEGLTSQDHKHAYIFERNFSTFGLEELSLKERIQFIKDNLNDCRSEAVEKMVRRLKIDEIHAEEQEEYTSFFKELIHKNNYFINDCLSFHFSRLGMDKILPNQRIKLCLALTRSCSSVADNLARNFDKLGFTEHLHRYILCKEFETQRNGGRVLIDHFDKFGFVEDIQALDNVNDRLAMAEKIVDLGDWAAEGVNKRLEELGLESLPIEERIALCDRIVEKGCRIQGGAFKQMGFVEEILRIKDLAKRLAYCKEFADKHSWAAENMAVLFEELGLEEVSAEERLSLCRVLVSGGDHAIYFLIEEIDRFNIKVVETEELIDYFVLVIEKYIDIYGFCCKKIIENIPAAATVKQRLKLYYTICERGGEGVYVLADKFDELKSCEMTAPQRFDLAMAIIRKKPEAAEGFVSHLAKIDVADLSDFISLCTEIALQGGSPASALEDEIETLRLEEASFEQQVALCRAMTTQVRFFPSYFLHYLKKVRFSDREKRALAMELLVPPHCLRWESREVDFLSDLEPVTSLLLKQEREPIASEVVAFASFLQTHERLSSLKKLFEKSKGLGDEQARRHLFQWVAYTAGILFDMENEKLQAIEESGLIEEIYRYRNPANRFAFVRQMRLLSADELMNLGGDKSHQKEVKSSKLISLLFARIRQLGFCDLQIGAIYEKMNRIKQMKDTARANDLIQLLLAVIDKSPYSKVEMKLIIDKIEAVFSPKEPIEGRKRREAISNELQTLTNILVLFDKKKYLQLFDLEESLDSLFLKMFQELFDIGDIDNFSARYSNTFGKFRNTTALFTYRRSINKLPFEEKKEVLKALNAYVKALLENTFPAVRYDPNKSRHIAHLFKNRPDLKQRWLDAEEEKRVKKTASTQVLTRNYRKLLQEKILVDKHLNPEDFPLLRDFLRRKDNGEKIEITTAADPRLAFQKLAIDLCRGMVDVESFIEKVTHLELPLGEFAYDLSFLKPQPIYGKFTISEGDHPCDLLLLGEEVGSCQRLGHESSSNKCLVAILMNGEIRPIMVKNGDKIVARSILRLMWDEKNLTPVLLQERIYSNVDDSAVSQAIQDWAIRKAERMGIPLVSKEVGEGMPYDGTVEFLGGFAPFVYSDASGGSRYGPFKTLQCRELYSPSNL